MKTSKFFTVAAILALSANASASVVYTNGGIDPNASTYIGYTINNKYSVADSFTLTSSTTLASATIALESRYGARPTSLTWAIGSKAFGMDFGASKSDLSRDPIGGSILFGTYWTFDLNATLGAGTYWLTLSDAVPETDTIYWLQTTNPTPPAYQQGPVGEIYNLDNGMYFSLSGDVSKVPEPATLAIIGLGLAGIGATRRRK
jgi:hypothetical protein